MTDSAQPNRDKELEDIVDKLDETVTSEREAKDMPGKPSEREQEQKDGSVDEPTA